MPNWTANRIQAEGKTADLRELIETIKGPDSCLDFNKIIPMPEILRHTGEGSCTIDGVKTDSWWIENPDAGYAEQKTRLLSVDEKAQLAALGVKSWYDWSLKNWGTKWNACECEMEDNSKYDAVEITFNTAWSEPTGIYEVLANKFPALIFEFSWRHEDEDSYPHHLSAGGEK